MRIWQCVDGHPVCEKCRVKLDSKGCPSCNRSVEGRNIALGEKIKLSKRKRISLKSLLSEKMARSLYGDK